MNANVGSTDRALRILAGCLLILLSMLGVIGAWGWVGLITIATGALRFCPAYTVLGLRSCPIDTSSDHA